MNTKMLSKLEKLRADYAQVKGQPFSHFYCPILFRDEDTELAKAHIVGRAFRASSRHWTVQRKDVDNFYCSNFEADFIDIEFREKPNAGRTITEKVLAKKFHPRILADNKQVNYFVAQGNIPDHFTPVKFDSDGRTVLLGLKMSPKDFLAVRERKWEIVISKDVRIPALVSLIKAAHLTLFEMLSYHYALSAGGYFVGRDVLGEFFLRNCNKTKSEVLKDAHLFFREFANMVRPIQSSSLNLRGTITDGLVLVCKDNMGSPWALIAFVKTLQSLHAVMIPILDQPDSAAKFIGFLKDEKESINVAYCRYEQGQWKLSNESVKLLWPKTGTLYP